MFYFTNYEALTAISNIMDGVINDEKIDMISKFYTLDAQMLLSEANILPRCMQCRRGLAIRILSVQRVHCDKRKICPDFYTKERSFSLVF